MNRVKELSSAELVVFIIAASILSVLWQRVFENLIYSTFGYSDKSTYISWILSVTLTLAVLLVTDNYILVLRGLKLQ